MNVRRLATWSLLAAASLGIACGGDGGADSGDDPIVSIGIGEPKFLIPSTATESFAHDVMHALFTPLVSYDNEFRPHELAAESITTTDNKVWTIRLRPGWTFHNGEPVTADSYINAWNAGAWGPNAHDGNYFFEKIQGYAEMNPRDAGTAPAAKKLTGLVKRDDLTFEVTLNAPYVNFKSMLGYTAFHPLPVVAFSDLANNVIDRSYQESPIGQGPFRMKGHWQHDQLIETVRYEDYAGEAKPKIGGVTYRIYQALTTQYQDLLAGQLDIVPRLPIENIGGARADLGDRFQQTPASVIHFLAFPTFDRRFNSAQIRRAISMAIDRDQITSTLFLDSQKPLRSFVSPVVPGYRENTCGEACAYDPVRAKALFEAAGGPRILRGGIEIAYNVDGGHKPWIDATCNQLRANLGIECAANPQPKFAELLAKVKAKEPVGLFRLGWIFDYPAMENYLGPLYTTYGSSNYYGYSNAEFDRLVAQGDSAATPEEATRLYQEAEAILVRDMPVIPLRYEQNNYCFSPRVKNVHMDAFNLVDLFQLEANTP